MGLFFNKNKKKKYTAKVKQVIKHFLTITSSLEVN